MNENQSGFLKFIAYLQITGIILVVLGHSFHEYPGGATSTLFYKMLYSFRMPMFLFVSGFLMVYTTRMRGAGAPGVRRFTASKIKRLLIPFVVLSLVTFIPRTMMSGMADDAIALSLSSLVDGLTDRNHLIIPYYWFLMTSFTLLVITYAVITLGSRAGIPDRIIYAALIIGTAALPYLTTRQSTLFSINMTLSYGIFFACGAAYCRYAAVIDRHIRWQSPLVMMLCAAVWVALYFSAYSTPLRPLCSLAGIAMCISFAKILEYRRYTFLDHLTGANYMIFLLSWFCNVASQQVLSHFVRLPWWVYSVLSLVSGIYIPWRAYRYLLRHRKSRWVRLTALFLGQSLKDKR